MIVDDPLGLYNDYSQPEDNYGDYDDSFMSSSSVFTDSDSYTDQMLQDDPLGLYGDYDEYGDTYDDASAGDLGASD